MNKKKKDNNSAVLIVQGKPLYTVTGFGWQHGHHQLLFYHELKCKMLFVVHVNLVPAYQPHWYCRMWTCWILMSINRNTSWQWSTAKMVIIEWYVGVLRGGERELRPADFRLQWQNVCNAAGESPLCSPSRVEVTENKPVVLSDVRGSPISSSEFWDRSDLHNRCKVE